MTSSMSRSLFRHSALGLCLLATGLAGCDAVLGSKSDPTTDEIFIEGQTDPTLVDDVGYVPLNPFYTQGFGGAFVNPVDVYVGYDEFVYVADDRGLHVLDLAGRPQYLLDQVEGQPLRDITAIVQGDHNLIGTVNDVVIGQHIAVRRHNDTGTQAGLNAFIGLRVSTEETLKEGVVE